MKLLLLAILVTLTAPIFANGNNDAFYIISGDKHEVERFEPYTDLRPQASVYYFGLDVNPNAKSHNEVAGEISQDYTNTVSTRPSVTVIGWSIGAKFVGQLLEKFDNIDKVILLDPMDGAPPLTEAGPNYPMYTNTEVITTKKVDVLIIQAGLGGEKSLLGALLGIQCDYPHHGEILFRRHLMQADDEVTHVVIEEAGHLDLLQGPFDWQARLACKEGPSPEDSLSKAVEEARKFLM